MTSNLEREITEEVEIALPNGRLNHAAVGWSRTPLHTDNLRGWGRNKRFEYWCITTPTHVFALNISHADYRVTLATFFLELESLKTFSEAEVHWLPHKKVGRMPVKSGQGSAVGTGKAMRIEMHSSNGNVKLRAVTDRMKIDLDVTEVAGYESMGVLVPWDEKRFQYTRKANCLPVNGTIVADGVEYRVQEKDSYATLDHGRGRWPHSIIWNWASASGRSAGREIGLQFGGKWTEGTPSTENSLRIDGRVQKISEELTWEYDTQNWMKPWRISGERVELEFDPVFDRHYDFNRLIVSSREHQVFGTFHGVVISDTGERVAVDDLFGWAEEVQRRW